MNKSYSLISAAMIGYVLYERQCHYFLFAAKKKVAKKNLAATF